MSIIVLNFCNMGELFLLIIFNVLNACVYFHKHMSIGLMPQLTGTEC